MVNISEILSKITKKDSENSIRNFFHFDADNIGDRLAGPSNYYFNSRIRNVNLSRNRPLFGNVIFGGGQIFSQMNAFTKSSGGYDDDTSLVAWGVGIPLKGKKDKIVRSVADRFDLFGTRNYEWRNEFSFVPCVSCMSDMFDNLEEPQHEVVVYSHRKKTPNLNANCEFPYMTNSNNSPESVAQFIASGNTIVTSSYHGVYWAQLLGRKVICIPFSDKFKTFQHTPFFSTEDTWKSELNLATAVSPQLYEYRELNNIFFRKVSNWWNIKENR